LIDSASWRAREIRNAPALVGGPACADRAGRTIADAFSRVHAKALIRRRFLVFKVARTVDRQN
jgi:hypothetical protein